MEDTPIVHLSTIDADAATGVDPTRWRVASWESTREIKSSALPGQIRTRTGLSVGTAKALVKRDGNDLPWKRRAVFDLSGQRAQLLIAPAGRTEIPTGLFRVAEIEGNLTTVGVAVELDERQVENTDQAPGVLGEQFESWEQLEAAQGDPIWLVSALAEQMGFSQSFRPLPGEGGYSPVLDVPFTGSLSPRAPSNLEYGTNDTAAYGTRNGVLGLTTDEDNNIVVNYEVGQTVPQVFSWTMDTDDAWAELTFDDAGTAGYLTIEVETSLGGSDLAVLVSSAGSNGVFNGSTSSGTLDVTRNPESPNRVQVEVTLNPASDTGYDSASVRVRRRDGFWFGPFVHSMSNQISRVNAHNVELGVAWTGSGTGFLANVSIADHASNDTAVIDDLVRTVGGEQGRIYLEPLVGTVRSPWLDPDLSVWSTIQHIIEAWQGALITDVYGDLRVLNRFTLAGVRDAAPEQVVDIGLRFEDLPWKMDYSDQADRLVVKYRPVRVQAAEPDQTSLPTIYEFQDVLVVYPGANEFFFTLDYVYPIDLKLLPFNRKDEDNGVFHVWDAYRYNNGSGNHIDPNTEIAMRIDRVTSSTWKVYVVNRTASPFHMVDSSGTPWLKIRSSYWFDQTQEATVELGLPANQARQALEVDLSNYVQNEEDAEAIARYLWGRVNARSWRASTVVSIPDYALDLGDVVELRHKRTGVVSNALVTKVELEGEPGRVGQKLDLVLLPPTWEDFDEAWIGAGAGIGTWDDFDALWDDYTWDDFDRTPTATTVAEIEEGM